MKKLISTKPAWLFLVYGIIDVLCTGAGMGVPVFCILLGFFSGWFIMNIMMLRTNDLNEILTMSFKYASATTFITFLLMLITWGGAIMVFFSHSYHYENFGHPFILYDPKLSFFGWLVLMIVVSPLLQLLTTVFSLYLTLMINNRTSRTS